MKVTLEFNEDEAIEVRQSINGPMAHATLWEIVQLLKRKKDEFDEISSEKTFQEVMDIILENNININE